MVYRRTPKMQSRIDAAREQIVTAAHRLVAESGYGGTGIPDIAKEAGVSTGSVYVHFPSKTALFSEVYQRASRHEIEAFREVAEAHGTARERLARMVETFARRALAGRKLAWALLVESVNQEIDAERLRFREPYRAIIEDVINEGINADEFVYQDARVTSMCIVGAIVEALVGPLSNALETDEEGRLVDSLTQVCLRSAGPINSEPRG
ncbi:TetR/AcrR family transcriptional regulator [Aquamicrobium sp. LC103]|nr:TetR/AcrR family transcriptional regulator [Aquamicrobium sp. LC103]